MSNTSKLGLLKGTIKLGSSSAVLQKSSPLVSEFESFEALQTALSSTGSINLTGRKFAITQNVATWADGISLSADERNISGGTIYGGSPLSWTETSSGSGVYKADLPTGADYTNWSVFLIDDGQANRPNQYMYPAPAANGWADYPQGYNESWLKITDAGSSVLGTVETDGAGFITSITITDVSTAQAVNVLINSGSQTIPCVSVYSQPNVVRPRVPVGYSYDSENNSATFDFGSSTGIQYSNYASIAISGILNESILSSGEYTIAPAAGDFKIWYKPANGDPNDAILPSTSKILTISANTTFDGTSFYGSNENGAGSPSGLFVGDANPDVVLTLNDCIVKYFFTAIKCTRFVSSGSIFADFIDQGVVFRSCTVNNCAFLECIGFPLLWGLALPPDNEGDFGLNLTTITNCFFKTEFGVHTQALSLYSDSWQNAIVKNNIFYNCFRAFSAQHQESALLNNWGSDGDSFVFENNLCYYDSDSLSSFSSGQATIAMLGVPIDAHFNRSGVIDEHRTYFRHNTALISGSLIAEANTEARYVVDTKYLDNSKVIAESNIVGAIHLSAIGEGNNWDGQWQYRNAKFGIGYRLDKVTGFGETDLSMPSSTSTIANYTPNIENGFHIKSGSPWETAASDSGPIGARFSPMPTPQQLAELVSDPLDWSSTYVPQPLPVFNETLVFTPTASNDRVNEDDDFRP